MENLEFERELPAVLGRTLMAGADGYRPGPSCRHERAFDQRLADESLAAKSASSRVTIVVVQQSAESFATLDLAIDATDMHVRFYQPIPQALMVPFRMIVIEELVHGSAHRLLPEEDHAIQALTLQTSHESLHVRI